MFQDGSKQRLFSTTQYCVSPPAGASTIVAALPVTFSHKSDEKKCQILLLVHHREEVLNIATKLFPQNNWRPNDDMTRQCHVIRLLI